MNGILLIDKPAGWTSHDVVAKVRGILRYQAKSQKLKAQSQNSGLSARDFQLSARGAKLRIGHTGTLDPFATGLLILVVGSYTKRASEFSKLDKTYEAEITLGATSSTGDKEGKISPLRVVPLKGGSGRVEWPSRKAIEAVLGVFRGEIEQTPHKFSAIKVGGQRAYKLARQGKEVKIEPRKVTVYSLQLVVYRFPKLKIVTEVSSGTYIRSLAEDIGQKLDTGAYLSALRRTSVGKYQLKDAVSIDNINIGDIITE